MPDDDTGIKSHDTPSDRSEESRHHTRTCAIDNNSLSVLTLSQTADGKSNTVPIRTWTTPSRSSRNENACGEAEKDSGEGIKSKTKLLLENAKWFLLDQWFLFVVSILVIIASQVQVPLSQQHIKETVITYLSVVVIFFITGCTLPTKVLLDNYSRWKIHLFVQIQCFLMTSATTFGVVSACATNKNFMDPWLLIGLIFLGSVPTTISSNVLMTRQAHGNTALTVVQSTVGNFLSPLLTPLLLQMYTSTGAWYTKVLPTNTGGYGEIYRRVFKQLGLSLFLPLCVGQVVQRIFPTATHKVFTEFKLAKLGSLALLVIIWQTFDQAFATGAFTSVKGDNVVFIVFISIAFFILWLSICFAASLLWLPKEDIIAVAYCVPAKTPAMGVPLSTVMYVGLKAIDESKLQIPMVIFQAFQVAFGSLLTIAWRKWIASPGKDKQSGNSNE